MSPSLGRLEFMDVLKKKMFMSMCVFHSAQFPVIISLILHLIFFPTN